MSQNSSRGNQQPTSPRRISPLYLGVVLVVVGFSLASVSDGISKLLTTGLPVLLVVWGRLVVNAALLVPTSLIRHGHKTFVPDRFGLQFFRAAMLTVSIVAFIWALSGMPLADALAIVFAYPLVITMFSPMVLGEPSHKSHWLAVIVGFAGVLVVIRPGFNSVDYHALLALLAGAGYAGTLLITRLLSRTEPPLVTLSFSLLFGALALSFSLPWVWQTITVDQLGLLLLSGIISAAVHLLINHAYTIAPAATLAPIGYSEIIAATAVGFVLFGDFPDIVTWVGIAIITASGIYIATTSSSSRVDPAGPTL